MWPKKTNIGVCVCGEVGNSIFLTATMPAIAHINEELQCVKHVNYPLGQEVERKRERVALKNTECNI